MVGLARPQKTFMVPNGSSMFARKCGLVNCPLRTDLDIRNLINSNAYGESKGQENKRGKKIKKQAKMSKSTKNFINNGTGLQSQLWGRKAGGSLLNSRPSWPLQKALGQQELHSDSPRLQKLLLSILIFPARVISFSMLHIPSRTMITARHGSTSRVPALRRPRWKDLKVDTSLGNTRGLVTKTRTKYNEMVHAFNSSI